MLRRDRNHPSVILWSIGNEVGEQYTGEEGAAVAARLRAIVHEEDPTRPTTTAMNWAKPDMPFAAVVDVISLNYQGEGIRDAPEYAGPAAHPHAAAVPRLSRRSFPDKLIVSSETAAAVSSRGEYLFPVSRRDQRAGARRARRRSGDSTQVSAYELHAADFGSSADKVFAPLDAHPYVAGEFVWTGWDYLGEPTPYYSVAQLVLRHRSTSRDSRRIGSTSTNRAGGPICRWRTSCRTGPGRSARAGDAGPRLHVRRRGGAVPQRPLARPQAQRRPTEYRLRWDDVVYEPGELKVRRLQGRRAVGHRRGADRGPAGAARDSRRSRHHPRRRPRSVVRDRARARQRTACRRRARTTGSVSRSTAPARSSRPTTAIPRASRRSRPTNARPSTGWRWRSSRHEKARRAASASPRPATA